MKRENFIKELTLFKKSFLAKVADKGVYIYKDTFEVEIYESSLLMRVEGTKGVDKVAYCQELWLRSDDSCIYQKPISCGLVCETSCKL